MRTRAATRVQSGGGVRAWRVQLSRSSAAHETRARGAPPRGGARQSRAARPACNQSPPRLVQATATPGVKQQPTRQPAGAPQSGGNRLKTPPMRVAGGAPAQRRRHSAKRGTGGRVRAERGTLSAGGRRAYCGGSTGCARGGYGPGSARAAARALSRADTASAAQCLAVKGVRGAPPSRAPAALKPRQATQLRPSASARAPLGPWRRGKRTFEVARSPTPPCGAAVLSAAAPSAT